MSNMIMVRRIAVVVALLSCVMGGGGIWRFAFGRISGHAFSEASAAWYHVYFTRPHPNEQERDRHGGVDTAIVQDFDRADHSILVASFDLDLRSVTDALLRAQTRKVGVRLVMDAQNLDKPLTAWMIGELQRHGVLVAFDRRRAFMHNKFIVIDDRVVWSGSANLTLNDTFRNDNNLLRIVDGRLAANYRTKFAALFAGQGGPHQDVAIPYPHLTIGSAQVFTAFAPDTAITAEVVRRIDGARRRVDVLAFTFTSTPIAEAISRAVRRGVPVRVVFDQRSAGSGASMMEPLRQGGTDVRVDGNCYTMHDKVIVVDEQAVVTGSFNWTAAAQDENDENVLMVDDPALARRYSQEFERIYGLALHPDHCR